MGDRYGPIVVARKDGPTSLEGVRVAIPGTLTTAFSRCALRSGRQDFETIRSTDPGAVRAADAEAGLLIHEGQLTYADEGLRKIVDLGEWWADRTGGSAAAARRQRHPPRSRQGDNRHAVAAAARQHRLRRSRIERGGRWHAMQFGRGLDRADGSLRRHVRERVDARLRRPRTRGRARLLDDAFSKGLVPVRSPWSSRVNRAGGDSSESRPGVVRSLRRGRGSIETMPLRARIA